MRVKVISDVHGAVDRLRGAAGECDTLVVLGDLINVIDYRTMEGILVDVFGKEPVVEAASLRARGHHAEARSTLRRHAGDGTDHRARFEELAAQQYEEVLSALPPGTILTYGNVDVPELLRSLLPEHVRFVDGEAIELGGLRWGIVGGGMRTPLGIPGEVDPDAFWAKLDALPEVDVVGTHVPPSIPWYCYDVIARKFEPGSAGLVRFITERRPRYSLFGHVHQPLASSGSVGGTQLVNVGYFRGDGAGWTHDWPD